MKQNPYEKANILSRLSYWWLRDMIRMGLKKEITEDEVYGAAKTHRTVEITKTFSKYWDKEKQKPAPSLLKVLFKVYGLSVLSFGFIGTFIKSISRILRPLFLGGLILYYTPDGVATTLLQAYGYATGIVLTTLLPLFVFHPMQLFYFETSMKMKAGCISLIYEKILRMSVSTLTDGLNGQAVNLISNDVATFDYATCFLQDLWVGPVEAVVMGFFIYREIGYFGLSGIGLMLLFIPLQAWMGRMAAKIRLKTALRTDTRIKFMNEIIQGVQMIKMYCWEYVFGQSVAEMRKKELSAIRQSSSIKAALLSFHVLPQLSIFLSFVLYAYFNQDGITSKKAFIVIAYFNALRQTLVDFWPLAIASVAEGYVSCKRVEKFLLIREHKEKHLGVILRKDNSKGNSTEPLHKEMTVSIYMKDVTAYWVRENQFNQGLSFVNLNIQGPSLTMIVGKVGSGKSTLLQIFLGELEIDYGQLCINGSISYAAQEPWLFNASVKSNIVYNETFNENRYMEVLRVCDLNQDLLQLAHGDETLVGEKGTSLSGGQKARLNLARAVYKQADIYIFDDPLSALDAKVGKFIFEACINGFLKNKLCVLVTHQLQYLSQAHHIIVMNEGKVSAQGTFEDIKNADALSLNGSLKMEKIKADGNEYANEETNNNDANLKNKLDKEEKGGVTNHTDEVFNKEKEIALPDGNVKKQENEKQHVTKENQSKGAVNINVYFEYVKAAKNWFIIAVIFSLFLVTQTFTSGADYFVSVWTNWEEKHHGQTDKTFWSTSLFVYIYSAIVLTLVITVVFRAFGYYFTCIRISANLHNKLYEGVVRAKMAFFNKNPSGRILNRFSKDIGTVDNFLPVVLVDTLMFFSELAGIIVLVSYANYWLVIPTIIMAILFYFLRYAFLTAARNVKRVEAITRSPIFAHMNTTFQGLTTIKACNGQASAIQEFAGYLDINTTTSFLFIAITRGFAFWLDIVSALYLTAVTYGFLILGQNTIGGNVGLAITQAINLVSICNWGLRQTSELENQMTSVERIVEYANVEKEPELTTNLNKIPDKTWPSNGNLKFKDVCLRYDEELEYALKGITFDVCKNEKIGIVGRTGAGKSSIAYALFRLCDYDGEIRLDDVILRELGLHTFRSKISVIPQDPVLFSGTLRMNIDPCLEKTDSELWFALDQVELKSTFQSLSGGLDTQVANSGSNFSVGQRQLICMARALLRNNKLLLLDEATANVDKTTDDLIQKTIRVAFKDCTVVTIAHRINTLFDYDRIIVMSDGKIVENNTPTQLLQIPGGYFKQLVYESGIDYKNK